MTDVEIDLPIEPDEIRDRFSRLTAIAIALITLVAAGVGFLHATAVQQNDYADIEAQRLGVQSFSTLVASEAKAQLELEAYATSTQSVAMRWSRHQDSLAASDADRPALTADSELWAALARLAAERTAITDASPIGPDLDLRFPSRFLMERSEEGFRLSAVQDAVVEYGSGWGARASSYTAVLALLAVSVYLLGLSLTVAGSSARRSFALTGAILGFTGVGWTVLSAVDTPDRAPDAAAEHFAAGRVAALTAITQADFARADEEYSAAIELRPTFALAYVNRANARFSAGSPQVSGLLSAASLDAVRMARDDLEMAVRLGLETPEVAANLAFFTYLTGLLEDDPADLDRSVDLTRRAIELGNQDAFDTNHTVLLANLGVALLAAHRDAEARQEYETFVTHLTYTDAAGEELRPTVTAIRIAAGAISDLEVLLARRPDTAATVHALKPRIVAAVAQAGAVVGTPTVRVRAGDAVVFPGELQLSIDYDGLEEADYLSVYWYREASDGSGWHVLPDISGPLWHLDTANESNVRSGEASKYHYLAPLIERAWPPRCVDGGNYRGEIYLNDQLVDQVEGTAQWGVLKPFVFRDLGIALCGPTDWHRAPDRKLSYSDGYLSPDGSRGALVQRIHASGQSMRQALESALEWDGLPTGLVEIQRLDDDFLGLDQDATRDFGYPDGSNPDGTLRVQVGYLPRENVYLALIVFGPDAYWHETPACARDDRDTGEACGPLNLISSARQFDVAPASGDETPIDTGEISFGTITFSEALTDAAAPLDAFAAAPSGSNVLCASWEFEGISDGTSWAAKWSIDGVESADYSLLDLRWDAGASGRQGICIGGAAEPLPVGEYELVLTVEGDSQTANSLFVGGDHPIVTFEIDNRSGLDVCYVYLAHPTAHNWGPSDLPETEVIEAGSTGSLDVPSGRYDLRVSDCDGATLSETFGGEVGVDTPPFVVLPPSEG